MGCKSSKSTYVDNPVAQKKDSEKNSPQNKDPTAQPAPITIIKHRASGNTNNSSKNNNSSTEKQVSPEKTNDQANQNANTEPSGTKSLVNNFEEKSDLYQYDESIEEKREPVPITFPKQNISNDMKKKVMMQERKAKDYGHEAEKSTSVSDGDEFPLTVKMLNGKVLYINVTIKDTMGKVMDKISKMEELAKDTQVLVHAGKVYRYPSAEAVTLKQAGIYPGPFLQPVFVKQYGKFESLDSNKEENDKKD